MQFSQAVADKATAMRTRILSGHSSERVTELLSAKLRDELDAQRSIAHRVWESVRDLFTGPMAQA